MNIAYTWADVDQTTLLVQFSQGWTFAEHEESFLAIKALITEQPSVVNVVWDFSQATTMPLHALTNFNAFEKRIGLPANFGMLIMVTSARFIETMINVANRTFANRRNRILLADTMDTAYALLMDRSERVAVQ